VLTNADVNKSFYGILSLTLHFFKLERGELDSEGMKDVFPAIRACRQTSPNMDAVLDQISQTDAQALPCATGIRLTPRDPQQLAAWISEGHRSLQDFDAPSTY
jgi:phenylacetate 2-hydroxylase